MIGERLKKIRIEKNFKQADLVRILGISKSYISELEANLSNPGSEILKSIYTKLGININWLLSGEGEMYVEKDALNKEDFIYIPELGDPVSAGKGCFIFDENVVAYYCYPKDFIRNELLASENDLFIMRVMGDSMEPTLNDDDLIMVDKSAKSLRDGKIYVMVLDNELLVKRAVKDDDKTFTLNSDNKVLYSPIQIKDPSNIEIVGRVIWRAEKFR